MSEENKPARRQYRRTTERRQEILVAVVQLLSDPDCCGGNDERHRSIFWVLPTELFIDIFSGKAEILEELIGFCDASFERMFDEINTESNVTMVMRAMVKGKSSAFCLRKPTAA